MKVDILAIGSHPDDVELACSGTIAKHIKQGARVAVVDLSKGELGTRGNAELRKEEATRSAEILGISKRVNLGLKDGFFEINEQSLNALIEQIRFFRPEIILCNSVHDRHPDHGRGGDLVSRASFLAGLRKVESKFDAELQEAWRPKAIYRYIQDRWIEPDLIVDISEVWQTKLDSIRAFSSQFYDPNSKEPESPISSKGFFDFLDGRARQFGRIINAEYGEGFNVERSPGVENLLELR